MLLQALRLLMTATAAIAHQPLLPARASQALRETTGRRRGPVGEKRPASSLDRVIRARRLVDTLMVNSWLLLPLSVRIAWTVGHVLQHLSELLSQDTHWVPPCSNRHPPDRCRAFVRP